MNKNRQKKRTALGNRLRTLRRCNGMTQREVAARLHLDRSSYAYYEIGKTEPDLHTLSEIAGIFQVSTDYLLGRGEYIVPIQGIRCPPFRPLLPPGNRMKKRRLIHKVREYPLVKRT